MSNQKTLNGERKAARAPRTWLLRLDGCVFPYKTSPAPTEEERPLPKVIEFFRSARENGDKIVLLTSRSEEEMSYTRHMLRQHDIIPDAIVHGIPFGQMILVDDIKPAKTFMGRPVNLRRDEGLGDLLELDGIGTK